jgi:hypothetical protein
VSRRFVIEGEWSGYHSGQQRVVHRTVHEASERRLRAWADKTHAISYTDGTRLILSVRDCKPRERVKDIINGYTSLIRDCVYYDVSSVHELGVAQQAARAARSAA